ncbi:MAG: class I SAM-dependent methyltransferase [Pseudomonadota bacterium]
MTVSLWDYLRREKKKLEGWLQRVDAEIYGSLLECQKREGFSGSCAEIGVHHGKSFIPLCVSLKDGEKALAIDIFDDQEANRDRSGQGDYDVFTTNIDSFGIGKESVRVISRSSEDVSATEILESVGEVRFFSVDGGHWSSIVQNDLALAEQTLTPDGVIALDDYCRPDWPDVTYGYALWQNSTESDIVPFAAGSNKLYLCRQSRVKTYQEALRGSSFLAAVFVKRYSFEDRSIDCYRDSYHRRDEENKSAAMLGSLSLFRPSAFVFLKRLRWRIARTFG